MDVTPEFMSELQQQAGQLRASHALGRSSALSRLFDYLLERSLAGDAAPKEVEIAWKVFGKPADFDGSSDAVVRVYVHKLRRRLDEYYSRSPGVGRIVIPKGEYRLVLEPSKAGEMEERPSLVERQHPAIPLIPPAWKRRAVSALAVFGAAILGAVVGVKLTTAATSDYQSCVSE